MEVDANTSIFRFLIKRKCQSGLSCNTQSFSSFVFMSQWMMALEPLMATDICGCLKFVAPFNLDNVSLLKLTRHNSKVHHMAQCPCSNRECISGTVAQV